MRKALPDYVKKRLSSEDLASSRNLLQMIEQDGSVTQLTASKAIGLSPGTCSLHFQKLEHLGLIRKANSIHAKGRGRSTTVWEFEQEKNLFLVIIVGVPFFNARLVDFAGTVLLHRWEDLTGVQTGKKLEDHVENFVNAAVVHAARIKAVIRQVYIGLPGTLDPETGVVTKAVNLPAAEGIDFKQFMADRYDLPCYCGSEGLAFYYAEADLLPPHTKTLMLFWDLGIGAVAGVGDRIITHQDHALFLWEIGHVRIKPGGRTCHCGREGCLEAYVGGWALIELLNDKKIRTLDEFRKAVKNGHPAALKVAQDAARLLGSSLPWALQIMQSERIVISGPLSVIFQYVRDAFIEGLKTIFTENEIEKLNPTASVDPNDALKKGAYRFARRLFFYPDE